MRMWMVQVLLASMALTAANVQARDHVFGLWVQPDSLLEVRPVDNDSLEMRIVAMVEPNYNDDEAEFGQPGTPRVDHNNPNAELRQRPLMNMNLVSEYRWDGNKWRGNIYDPESGKTYKSIMTVDKKGRLSMRGYIGVPMMGRTAKFDPISNCDDHTLALLTAAGLEGC